MEGRAQILSHFLLSFDVLFAAFWCLSPETPAEVWSVWCGCFAHPYLWRNKWLFYLFKSPVNINLGLIFPPPVLVCLSQNLWRRQSTTVRAAGMSLSQYTALRGFVSFSTMAVVPGNQQSWLKFFGGDLPRAWRGWDSLLFISHHSLLLGGVAPAGALGWVRPGLVWGVKSS